MRDIDDDDDAATNLVERRWFAASAQVKALQEECALMQKVMEQAAQDYRGARLRLAQLESLRDGLAARPASSDEMRVPVANLDRRRRERSAA
jgi:hypothetical protein